MQDTNETQNQRKQRMPKTTKECKVMVRTPQPGLRELDGYQAKATVKDLAEARKKAKELLAQHPDQEALIVRVWGPFRMQTKTVAQFVEAE